MTTRRIPFSAYLDLQAGFAYKAAVCSDFDRLATQVSGLDERKFFALASCLLPFSVNAEDLGNQPSTVTTRTQLLIDLLSEPPKDRRPAPTDPRNYVDWERLCEHAGKSKAIHGIVSTLLGSNLDDFVQTYSKERAEFRESTTRHLERQQSPYASHVRCPQQQDWIHEAVFHDQFCIAAIGIDKAVSESSINGLLSTCLDQVSAWLKDQGGQIALSVTHFKHPVAHGDYEDGRIQWRYRVPPDKTHPFRMISSPEFLNAAHESAKRSGLNLRKNLYLGHELGL